MTTASQPLAAEDWSLLKATLFTHGGMVPLVLPAKPDPQSENDPRFELPPLPLDDAAIDRSGDAKKYSLYGARCGGPSGLVALVFPSDEEAKQLLKVNPSLAGSLATTIEEKIVLWIRAGGRLPPTAHFPGLSFISDGLIPYLSRYAMAGLCTIHRRCGVLAEVNLRTLLLGELGDEFLADWFAKEDFGAPFIQVSPKRIVLATSYWAAYISRLLGITFNSDRFFIQIPGKSGLTPVAPRMVLTMVARVLNMSRERLPFFPVQELRPKRLKAVVEAIKTIAAETDPDESTVIADFVRSRIERRPSATVTSAELGRACQLFRKFRGLPPNSMTVLHRALKQEILVKLGAHQSGDITREGTMRRGYRGLALRSPPGKDLGAKTTASTAAAHPGEQCQTTTP